MSNNIVIEKYLINLILLLLFILYLFFYLYERVSTKKLLLLFIFPELKKFFEIISVYISVPNI